MCTERFDIVMKMYIHIFTNTSVTSEDQSTTLSMFRNINLKKKILTQK